MNLYLEFNDNGEVSPLILWDTLKAVLRGKIIAISSYKKTMRNKTLDELQNNLRELEKRHKLSLANDILDEIKKIRDKINNLAIQEVKKNLCF